MSTSVTATKIDLFLVTVTTLIALGHGQETVDSATATCYSAGSIVGAVLGTFLGTLFVIGALLFLYKRRIDAKKDNHLILETDPERGPKAEYAFDNPGFKDASIVATSEKLTKPNSSASKWTHWSPLAALNLKPEKRRALDDSALQSGEVKVVALKSQDFTGLGFNICGNMKEGIFIRDILHRGPAFESGKLNPGDRINSVTISFEHMVYEDALNILSYASPYEVILEAKSGRIISFQQGQGQTPVHPIYRTCSAIDLSLPEKSAKKKLFGDDYSSSSNYSSLQKSRSNVTTLERKESKSPRPPSKPKSKSPQKLTPEIAEEQQNYQKFGVRVLPLDHHHHQKSPKILEQNQNNSNIERHYNMDEIPIRSIDEVDLKPPQARKREKKSPEQAFERNGSGIKRDSNGIPLEIPDHMQDAALAARRNRKSSIENGLGEDSNKRHKAKAPSPPPINFTLGAAFEDLSALGTDSEDDTNNMSSVNTIELNSSDITIHQIQEEERKSRKTASTGDLTKMKKQPRSNSGTLERAQSLDITDTSGHGLTKKSTYDATENLLIDKEPRLSLILDGLTTFQRSRLKTSAEWGNLEDAILNYDERKSDPQLTAVMDRVIQIKRESQEIEVIPDEVIKSYQTTTPSKSGPKVFNKLWPDESELSSETSLNWKKSEVANKRSLEVDVEPINRQPVVPERFKLKELPPQPTERVMAKPVPPKRDMPDRCSTEINLNHTLGKVSPKTAFEKNNITELCSQLAKGKNSQMIKDEWEVDTLNNTSPPQSMTLVDEVMDSYNKSFGEATAVQANMPDESKNMKCLIDDFIFKERSVHLSETNIPDDVKVSRNSFESLDAKKCDEEFARGSFGAVDPKQVKFNEVSTSIFDKVKVAQPKSDGGVHISTSSIYEKVKVAPKLDEDVKLVSTTENDVKVFTNSIEQVGLTQTPNPKSDGGVHISTSSIFEKVKLAPKLDEDVKVSTSIIEEVKLVSTAENDVKVSTNSIEKVIGLTQTPKSADDVKVSTSIFDKVKRALKSNDDDVKVSTTVSDEVASTAQTPRSTDDVEVSTSLFEKVKAAPKSGELQISKSIFEKVKPASKPDDDKVKDSTNLYNQVELALKSEADDVRISTNSTDNEAKPSPDLFEKVKLIPKSNFDQDITVSTSSLQPTKSDDTKSDDSLISHVTVMENGASNLHSLELSINSEPNELYKTVVDTEVTVIMSQPNVVTVKKVDEPLVEITETSFSKVTTRDPEVEITTVEVDDELFKSIDDESPAISLIEDPEDKKTYVTEIQVLPSPTTTTNVSEIEVKSEDHLEDAFENYVKNFEKKLETFESNMQNFENNLEEFIRDDEPRSVVLEETIDIEKQVSKIQEIAEEQLNTLPEMKFSTSSYETSNAGRKTPEKRHSFELLRSNFEKSDRSPPRRESTGSTPPKSRIPISTTMKTPPMSPERRNSRTLDNENDKAILELMSSPPFVSKIKPPTGTKNVSITSIRQNSKIPSGLPTLSGRPPIPPRKSEETANGGVESSFKQWVFNPNSNVTNVTVGKEK